jgi:hypothetical protein
MIQKLGKGALLAKADIKSAFRLLKIWQGDLISLGSVSKISFILTDVCQWVLQ